ncbi:MAG: hypothetical protein HZA24_06020 [Nitrospirae bacterium]|nr:hypothetical protein [Nitrospirota bacterium]
MGVTLRRTRHHTARLVAGLLYGLLWLAPVAHAQPVANTTVDTLKDEVARLRADLDTLLDVRLERQLLSGYFDFDYVTDNKAVSPGHFRAHHLSLFVTRQWRHARMFSEVEFEDGADHAGSGAGVTGDGQVKLENAWVEYNHGGAVNLRAGKLFLPQYWNVNHYPTTVLTTQRPLMVRAVFPADITGVMLHGTAFSGDVGYGYRLYTGNGQGPNPSATDDNENKAVGLHLTLHLGDTLPGVSRLDLALTGYSERTAAGAHDIHGAEAQLDAGRLGLLAEYAAGAEADTEGFYVQPAWRLTGTLFGVYRYDYLDDGARAVVRHTAGVDWRPVPNLSLKTSVDHHDARDGEDYQSFNMTVAAFF